MFKNTPFSDTSQNVGMFEQEGTQSTTKVNSSRPKINFAGVATNPATSICGIG